MLLIKESKITQISEATYTIGKHHASLYHKYISYALLLGRSNHISVPFHFGLFLLEKVSVRFQMALRFLLEGSNSYVAVLPNESHHLSPAILAV